MSTIKILSERRQTETKGLRALAAMAFSGLVSELIEILNPRRVEKGRGCVWEGGAMGKADLFFGGGLVD